MTFKRLSFGFVISFLLTIDASAQVSGVTYRRILLPVVVEVPVPGALGSLWRTDLGLTNAGPSPMWVYPIAHGPLCGNPVACTFSDTRLPPGLTVRGTVYYFEQGTPPSNGVVLHAEDRYADSLRVALRVLDVSRQAKSWGASLPVVPENRFLSAVTLTSLPGDDPNFRVSLRIYSLMTDVTVQVDVQAFAINPFQDPIDGVQDISLGTTRFSLNLPADVGVGTGSQPPGSAPSFLFIGDSKFVTGGKSTPRFRLEITSATPGATIWAFATITNNDTQEVTVVAPAEH